MRLHLTAVIYLLCSTMSSFAQDTEVWHKLNSSADERLWLVAREEAAFIREKIGTWLPIDLVRVQESSEVSWKVDRLERLNNKIYFKISLKNSDNKIGAFEGSYFSKGESGIIPCLVSVEAKETYISIVEKDGSIRRIMFKRGRDLQSQKNSTSISDAMPFWDWDKAHIVEM